MRSLRTLFLTATTAALAITAIGAPAAAAPFDPPEAIAVANGWPGQKVDVCIDGKEIRSRLRYGGWKQKVLGTGWHRIKIYKPNPRKCKGVLLAKRAVRLHENHDLTLVVTKKKTAAQPNRIVLFDNTDLGWIPTPAVHDPRVVLRHAADIGKIEFHANFGGVVVTPAGHANFKKGSEGRWFPLGGPAQVWVTRPHAETVIAAYFGSVHYEVRFEYILVGTNLKNAKLIRIRRPIDIGL